MRYLFKAMCCKEMATHSSILAWRILWTEQPGGLPSMGSHRVGHDWSDLAAAAAELSLLYTSPRWICCMLGTVFNPIETWTPCDLGSVTSQVAQLVDGILGLFVWLWGLCVHFSFFQVDISQAYHSSPARWIVSLEDWVLSSVWTFPKAVGSHTWQRLYFKVIVVACVPSGVCVLSRTPSNIGHYLRLGTQYLQIGKMKIVDSAELTVT